MSRTASRLLSALLPCLAAALPALLGAVLGQGEQVGKRYALLVGVREYRHEKLPDLKYSDRDVEELAGLLRPAGYQVTLLSTTAGKQEERRRPTLANIRRELSAILKEVGKHDVVLIALSGHGLQPEGGKDSFFCPADSNPYKLETLLSLGELYRELEESGVGVKLVLVDACRNEIAPGRSAGVDGGVRPPRGVSVLFACSPGQKAFEPDELRHGVFFHFVLEGLKGKAANERGEVTWSRLSEYVREQVPAAVPKLVAPQARQEPHGVEDLRGRSPVLLRAEGGGGEDEKEITSSIGMKLRLIPAGKFLMGSPEHDQEDQSDEKPQHEVTITRPFYLALHTVTLGQFRQFVKEADYQSESEKDGQGGWGYNEARNAFEGRNPKYNWQNTGWAQTERHPVVNVTWSDAVTFCAWLSRKEGREYRLPTEAEWEYACRAGTRTRFFTGDNEKSLDGFANVADRALKRKFPGWRVVDIDDGFVFAAPVGCFKPNPWGLYDMHGNVWQWCADWYDEQYYGQKGNRDPKGPDSGGRRVLRGGSWDNYRGVGRAALRLRLEPDDRGSIFGFRVACSLSPRTP
jgi:formylglycine-generating enzyme required for sulfatase activity